MPPQISNQARPYNAPTYLPNGGNTTGSASGATPLLPNQGRVIQTGNVKILCLADVRGRLRHLNELAEQAKANYIIHTGDFGFYDDTSLDRIAEKTLKHLALYSPLLPENARRSILTAPHSQQIKELYIRDQLPLSEIPQFLDKTYKLNVPVYTVWGACEDVQVLEKLRTGEYKIDNLNIVDEAHSRLLDVGGVKLRLLGLGGAVVMHKMFDNGEGRTTIAGGQGTMWTTLLQIGELLDTANRVHDPTETRIFITHASPAREGLLNQLSVCLKADFSMSAGLHFRYGSSYNEFSVNPTLDHYRGKLAASKASFNDVWETVKEEVELAVSESDCQQKLLNGALDLVNKMPSVANGGNPFGGHAGGPQSGQIDEGAFKNMWNFNLADAEYGWLVLDIDSGRIATEMKAQGFNFAHRGSKTASSTQAQSTSTAVPQQTSGGPSQSIGPQNRMVNPSIQSPQQSRPQPPLPRAATGSMQPQQAKMPTSQPPATGATPPTATPKDSIKPETSQHVAPASTSPAPNNAEKSLPIDVNPNGMAASERADAGTPKSEQAPPEKKPIIALFIAKVKDEAQIRSLLGEDNKKILRLERVQAHWIAHFSSKEDVQTALDNLPSQLKDRKEMGPLFKEYEDFGSNPGNSGNPENRRYGKWPGNDYRNGGDSDGGRGRGGGYGRGRGRADGRSRGRGRGGHSRGSQGEGMST